MMNEVTISRAEYDLMIEHRMMLNMYQKALTKCARFSDWRENAMVVDDEDFLEMVALFDYTTYCDVKRHCERQKAEAEKKKTAAAPEIKGKSLGDYLEEARADATAINLEINKEGES